MRRGLTLLALLLGLLSVVGCGGDDNGSMFPSMWNEIVCLTTDGQGRVRQLVTDAGNTYEVTNTLQGYEPGARYRVMCGYTINGEHVTLYQTIGVHLLRDSTACAAHDPLTPLAVWKSGDYINLHLAPLTQGGSHAWGFAQDSVTLSGRHCLSLHHRQGNDPLSFTQETYASIMLDSVPGVSAGDSISLSVHTFKGIKTWNFKR